MLIAGVPIPIMVCALDWQNRTDLQKLSFIASVIVVLSAICCLASNIATAVEADKGNWFAHSGQKKVVFFVGRSYAILFCAVVILAEFHNLDVLNTYFKAFRFFFVRGALQIFVGFMTLQGDSSPGDSSAGAATAAVGWVLIGVGILHLLLSFACFKEYNVALRHGDTSEMAPGAVVPTTPAAASPAVPDAGNVFPGGDTNAAYRI